MPAVTALLVATPGGHLTQLVSLLPRLPVDADDTVWVTSRTSQADAMLAGREVVWVPYTSPRDVGGTLRHLRLARELVRRRSFSAAISTGASHAVPFLTAASRAGVPSHFIDSATRVSAPSLSGRLLAGVPGINVYSQYRSRADARWRYGGSVFEGWRADGAGHAAVQRVVVTLGSAEGYGFRRLLERLLHVLPPDADVVWQTGTTDVAGLPIEAVPAMSGTRLADCIRQADAVVAHAGTGSALTALAAGKIPVLVPRSAAYGEHIDDHQQQIAASLARAGLAVAAEASEVELADLTRAAALRALPALSLPAFGLAA